MGDFNDLKVDETNSDNKFYKTTYMLPSIGKNDHLCVLYEPIDNQNTKTTKETITIRRFKKYALIEFGS